MNPLLYILILRDYLIELLNIKDNIKGENNDLLKKIVELNKDIQDLSLNKINKEQILNTFYDKIEKLETKIKELELEKINKTKTFEDIKLKQRENKSIRRKEIKLAKSKNQKKRIRKNLMSNISELNEKNNLILNTEKILNAKLSHKRELLQDQHKTLHAKLELENQIKMKKEEKSHL